MNERFRHERSFVRYLGVFRLEYDLPHHISIAAVLFLVVRPLFLVAMPGAPSSDALAPRYIIYDNIIMISRCASDIAAPGGLPYLE